MLPQTDSHRVAIGQLRSDAARLRRMRLTNGLDELLDQIFSECDVLLRDLAGQRFESEATAARLREDAAQSADASARLFDRMPVSCIETDANSVIVRANRAAALLLNLSAKCLTGRLLRLFSQHRDEFDGLLRALAHGTTRHRASMALRPRERAPFDAELMVIPSGPGTTTWLWFVGTADQLDGAPSPVRAAGRHHAR